MDSMIDKSWEGFRQFYELAFGTWIAYLFLLFLWKRLLKADYEGWRYALITVVAGSFYIINHYFFYAPFYRPLIYSYTIVFSILYYLILVKPLTSTFIKKMVAFTTSFIFTIVYIMAEELARHLVQGSLIPGVHVPEFLFLVISFFAGIGIILSHRKRH
jgi:hypothetical protein